LITWLALRLVQQVRQLEQLHQVLKRQEQVLERQEQVLELACCKLSRQRPKEL
jgi:hypothetical protein